MDDKEGLGDVTLPVEQETPPMASTSATLDDLKKLESSILSQMQAMMSELLAPKPNSTIDPKVGAEVSTPQDDPYPLLSFVPKNKAIEETDAHFAKRISELDIDTVKYQ